MAGISIPIAADTREFVKSVGKDMPDALEKAADALDALGKDGGKSGDKLESSMRDAQRSTAKTEEAFKDLARAQKKAADEGGDGFSRSVKKSTSDAGGAIREFGDEARQNIGETFSSFRGDVSDFGQIAQDTLGGLTTGLEGIPGVAAVAAGAAGIGLLMGAFQAAGEADEKFKAQVSALAEELIETGSTGGRSVQQIADKLKELATTGDDAGMSLKTLDDAAARSGSDFGKIARAYAGTTAELQKQWRAQDQLIAGYEKQNNARREAGKADDFEYRATERKIAAAKEVQGYLGQQITVTKEATKAQKEWAAAGGPELEAKAKAIENINDAYDSAAGSVDNYVDSETGVFNTDAYITAMQEKQQALKDYQDNLKSLGGQLGPEATAFLEGLGSDQASILLDAYKKATPGQQAEMAQIWAEGGKSDSASYMGNFTAGLPKTVDGPAIKVTVDDSAYATFKRNFGNPLYQPVILQRPGSAVQ